MLEAAKRLVHMAAPAITGYAVARFNTIRAQQYGQANGNPPPRYKPTQPQKMRDDRASYPDKYAGVRTPIPTYTTVKTATGTTFVRGPDKPGRVPRIILAKLIPTDDSELVSRGGR